MTSSGWTWWRAAVAVVCFAAWAVLLIRAGFGSDSVILPEASRSDGTVVWWFSPLVPIGAALFTFVRWARAPLAGLVAGVVILTLSGTFVASALAKVAEADPDGLLYTVGIWQAAIVLLVVVGAAVAASRDRPASRPPPRPDTRE